VIFRSRFIVCFLVLSAGSPASARTDQHPDESSKRSDIVGDDRGGQTYETVVAGPRAEPGESIENPGRTGPSVTDALSSLPALWVQQTVRGEHLVNLLGFDQKRLLVTIQGVPLLLPYDGFVDLGRFPAGFISHIRLRKGPSSLAFGPSGMGGSIDLELRSGYDAPRFDGSGAMAPESWDIHSLSGGAQGQVAWTMGAQLSKTRAMRLSRSYQANGVEDGGLRQNSDRRTGSVGLNLSWRISPEQDLSFFALGVLGTLGVPPSTSGVLVRYWRFSDHRLGLSGLAHRWHHRLWLVRSGLFVAGYGNTVDSYDDSSYLLRRTDRSFHSLFRDTSIGAYVGLERRFFLRAVSKQRGALVARFWADLRRDRHHQILDGASMPIMGTTLLRFAMEAGWNPSPKHRVEAQVELLGELPSPVTLVRDAAGGTTGRETYDAPPVWTANPIVTYQGRFGSVTLTAAAARRTRFPTLKERFSDGLGRRIPNPDLKPEGGWVGRTTAALPFLGLFVVRMSVFGALLDDLLEQRPAGEGKVQMDNVGRGLLSGTELSLAFIWRWITLSAAYRFLYSRILSGDMPMDSVPRHRGLLRARFEAWNRLDAQVAFAFTGPFSARDPDSGMSYWLEPALVLDALVQVQVTKRLFVVSRISNALDWDYKTAPGQPAPGFNLWCGLRLLVP